MSIPLRPADAYADDRRGCQSGRRNVVLASAHSIVDFSNGASLATLDVLQGLGEFGLECQAFCTSRLDLKDDDGQSRHRL